jgi:hypothetical protein
MRNLAAWLFSLLLATAAVAVPVYFVARRRAEARRALLSRNNVELTVVKPEEEREIRAPGGPDENTQLQPADVNAALPVIREFTQSRQKGLS